MLNARPRADRRGSGGGLFHRGRHGVAVVLDEEAQRRLPRGGQVHRFQHGPDVHRAVAEVGHRHAVGAGVLVRPAGAGGQRHAAAHDGVGAERARFQPAQVHAAPTAAAIALGQAHDLGQRLLQDFVDGGGERVARVPGPAGATCCSALARNWWWPRCDPLIWSPAPKASTEPTAPPSWPTDECAGPCTRPSAARSSTASSKARIQCNWVSMVPSRAGSALLPILCLDRQLPPGRLGLKRLVGGHE